MNDHPNVTRSAFAIYRVGNGFESYQCYNKRRSYYCYVRCAKNIDRMISWTKHQAQLNTIHSLHFQKRDVKLNKLLSVRRLTKKLCTRQDVIFFTV